MDLARIDRDGLKPSVWDKAEALLMSQKHGEQPGLGSSPSISSPATAS